MTQMKQMTADAKALLTQAREGVSYLWRTVTKKISPDVAMMRHMVAMEHDHFSVMHRVECVRLGLPSLLLAHDKDGLWIDRTVTSTRWDAG